MRRVYTEQNTQIRNTLYKVVFKSVYPKIAISLLFTAFVLQPIAPIYANETEDAENTSTTKEVSNKSEKTISESKNASDEVDTTQSDSDKSEVQSDTPEEEQEVSAESDNNEIFTETDTEGANNATIQSTNTSATVADTEVGPEIQSADKATTSEETEGSPESSVPEIEASVATSTSTISDTASTSDSLGSGSSSVATDREATSKDEIIATTKEVTEVTEIPQATPQVPDNTEDNDKSESQATSSEVVTPTVVSEVANTLVNDANRHQFSKDECVTMGDGSFFCSNAEDLPEYTEDGVFSVPDSDGDMEIMVRVNGEERFITDNTIDDLAPYFDSVAQRIVWHSMKNDRYQIASYSFETDEITFLTDTSYNNMEPVAYGDITLWQAWIKNNWEIMLFDGASTTQLTANSMNDISPQVRNGYILWQTQFADGWKLAMYDQKTDKIEYIGDAEGALATNPRLLLVYDSLDENGDVKTIGFDLDSGEIVPFTQIPSQLPEKLPEPQGTEEARALIQNKSNTKNNDTVDVNAPTGSSTPPTGSSTAAVSENTLDLNASSSATTTLTASTTESASDLVVPQSRQRAEQIVDDLLSGALKASTTNHIEDVVIPPLATSTNEVME